MSDRLKHFCMLPVYTVEVEKIANPDKSCHRVYWEWVDASGKKNIAPPKFSNGTWKLLVDVISADKFLKTYDAGENDDALVKLLAAAEGQGFKDTTVKTEKTSCNIDLQNGTLKILARKISTDDGWLPEVKFIYNDKDDLIRTSFAISLDSAKNLTDIANVFIGLAEKLPK